MDGCIKGLKKAIEQTAKNGGVEIPIVAAITGDDLYDKCMQQYFEK